MRKKIYKVLIVLFILVSAKVNAQIEYVTPSEKLNKAVEYFREGNYAKTQNLLGSFSANDSFYERSGELQYRVSNELSEYNEAIEVAAKFAQDLIIKDRDLFYKRAGVAAFYGTNHKRGIEILKEGLTHFPAAPGLLDYLAKNYIMIGEDSLAYEATMTGLEVNPFHTGLLENLGELNAMQGNYTQASMSWYLGLFISFHNSDPLYPRSRISHLMQKFQSVLGGNFERGLFPFNWDGKENSLEDYKDLKNPEPVSKEFIIRNYYESTDEILSKDLALNANYKAISKIRPRFAKQTQMMGQKFKELSKVKDAGTDYYVYHNLLENLIEKVTENKTYITHFQSSIMALFETKYLSKMRKKYVKKVIPINRELSKIMSIAMKGKPTIFNGEVQEVDRRFSAYTFKRYAAGKLIDNSGTDEAENRKGTWEYYYDNGFVDSRGQYVEGKKDGEWKEFDKLGILKFISSYDKGTLVQIKEYETNGVMVEKRNFKDFSLVDSVILNYPDGSRMKQFYLPKGSKGEGTVAAFHANGTKQFETTVKEFDYQEDYVYHNKRGIGVFDVQYKNGKRNGDVKEYYSNGNLYLEGEYKDGKKTGVWTYYLISGEKSSVFNFVNGEYSGKQEYFYSNGKLSDVDHYKDGEYDGEVLAYQRNGKMASKLIYDNGALKSIENFDETGKSIYSKKINGTTSVQTMHPNGVIKSKGKIKEGLKTGKWEYFTKFGVLVRSAEYSKGKLEGKTIRYYTSGLKYSEYFTKKDKRHGKYIGYYSNGKKSTEGFYLEGKREGEWLNFHIDGKQSDKIYFVEGDYYGFQFSYDLKGKLASSNYYKNDWTYYRVSYDSLERPIDTLHYVTPIGTKYYTLNAVGDTNFVINLSHNELHGIGTYYPGTERSYNITYNDGDLDKSFKIKNALGQLTAEKTYQLGKLQSYTSYNAANGTVNYKASYKFGELEGIAYDYYPNGSKKVETTYKNGSREGMQVRYAPDGNVVYVLMFEDDDIKSYGESKEKQIELDKPVAQINFVYANGSPKAVFTLKYGSYDGDWKVYNKNGKLGESRVYNFGTRNDADSIYNESGVLQKMVPYTAGETNGVVKVYNSKGKLVRESTYLNDDKQGWEYFYKNGIKIKSVYYYNDYPILNK